MEPPKTIDLVSKSQDGFNGIPGYRIPKTVLKNKGIIFSIGKEKNKDFITEVQKKSSFTPAPSTYTGPTEFAPKQKYPSIGKSPR